MDILREGAGQAWGKVEGAEGSGPRPHPQNLACLGFCPALDRAEPPGIGGMELPGTLLSGANVAPGRGGASQVQGKMGGMTPVPKTHSSVTDTPESAWTSTSCHTQPIPQKGTSPTGWGDRDSGEWGYFIPPGCAIRRGELHPKRQCLWCGRGIQHWSLGSCPFSSVSRATHPIVSSCDSSPLCPPLPLPESRVSDCG